MTHRSFDPMHSAQRGQFSVRTGFFVIATAVLGVFGTLVLGACDKPTEEDCRLAVENIRRLYNTNDNQVGAPPAAVLRSCVGGESTAAVKCFKSAGSKEELQKCEGGAMAKLFATDNVESKGPDQPAGNEPKSADDSDRKSE